MLGVSAFATGLCSVCAVPPRPITCCYHPVDTFGQLVAFSCTLFHLRCTCYSPLLATHGQDILGGFESHHSKKRSIEVSSRLFE